MAGLCNVSYLFIKSFVKVYGCLFKIGLLHRAGLLKTQFRGSLNRHSWEENKLGFIFNC